MSDELLQPLKEKFSDKLKRTFKDFSLTDEILSAILENNRLLKLSIGERTDTQLLIIPFVKMVIVPFGTPNANIVPAQNDSQIFISHVISSSTVPALLGINSGENLNAAFQINESAETFLFNYSCELNKAVGGSASAASAPFYTTGSIRINIFGEYRKNV